MTVDSLCNPDYLNKKPIGLILDGVQLVSMNKGQQTKEMIIVKAAELFNIKGYAACSLSDLMTATGLKKGGIYNHFSNKDELALEAFKYSTDKIEAVLAKITIPANSHKESLTLILDFYLEYALNPLIQGGCPILNTLVDADNTNPTLISLARKKTERLLKRLEYIIHQGQLEGEFQPNVEPRSIALVIFSGIEGALLLTKAYNDDQAIKSMIDCLHSYLETTLFIKPS